MAIVGGSKGDFLSFPYFDVQRSTCAIEEYFGVELRY